MPTFTIRDLVSRFGRVLTRPGHSGFLAARGLSTVGVRLRGVEAACQRWLIVYSIAILRISVGGVFLSFGALKFFPGVSPAQNLVETTTDILTLGLVPGVVALPALAMLECVIGLCLISGRGMRGAVYMLAVMLFGVLSPIVVLAGRMFAGPHGAPTLEGQYVLKDIVIVGAALVLAATLDGGHLTSRPSGPHEERSVPTTAGPTLRGAPPAAIAPQRTSGDRRAASTTASPRTPRERE